MIKIVCFKWKYRGGYKLPSSINNNYSCEHVNRLGEMLSRNVSVPYEFICITDDPKGIECRTIPLWDKWLKLGGCFNRLYVFSKDMKDVIGERFLCIDLDVVITGNIDNILLREEDFVINTFRSFRMELKQYYNGSLILMNAGAREEVWKTFEGEKTAEQVAEWRKGRQYVGTDQAWISHVLQRGEAMFTQDDGIENYFSLKNPDELPHNTRMVFFSGGHDPSTSKMRPWVVRHYYNDRTHQPVNEVLPMLRQLHVDAIDLCKKAERKLGYCPNPFHPGTFNEKVAFKKLFVRTPLITLTSDKYRVKKYVEEKGVKTIPTLYVDKDPRNIPFEKLPKPYIIKPNHRSGAFLVVKDRVDRKNIESTCLRWLSTGYAQEKHEWGYKNVERVILVEPLLRTKITDLLNDYKFYVFNGKCKLIHVTSERDKETKIAFFTPDWKYLDVTVGSFKKGERQRKPVKLKELISTAERLGEDFDLVRIDLYVYKGKVYFGEITHYPLSGAGKFNPCNFDYDLGKQIKMTVK